MDRRLLLCAALHTSAILACALPAGAQPAPNARPAGGSVVAGAATIAQSPSTTTIEQSTQRAAINWQSFDIGSQQTVQFVQPSASSVTLNRVVGPNPSQIAGQIDANGQVVITNQSGVVFYKGSQVNTAGLMVSAAGIGNANFMAGRMVFDQVANPNASVVNQGSITIRDAGLAALVAPQVANSGVINAQLGHVVLAGAQTATLDLYGDGLMAIDVTGQVVQAPNGATALVTNTGIIRADGGTVQLTARAADGIVTNLVDAGGSVRANTVGSRTGSIVLNGVGGSITVAGQLTAAGSAAGNAGGSVEVDPSGSVTIAATARIDASGRAGGGVIAIGTTLARAKGGPGVTPQQTAANVTVAAGATIAANATAKGNGGRVAVLSSGSTVMNGAISAQGGPQGGNGGFVEVSGANLGMTGVVNLAAPAGNLGTLLLDPTNLDVVAGNTGAGSLDEDVPPTGIGIFYNTTSGPTSNGNETVANGAIDGATANVILQATNNLTVDANTPIVLQSGISLTMQTQTGNILVNAGSPITASGAGNLTLQAGLIRGSGGTLTLNSNLTTDTAGRTTLQADAGIALNATDLTTGTLDVSTISGGGVSQSAGGQVFVTTLQSSNGLAGNVGLTSNINSVTNLGPFTVTGGSLVLYDASGLTIDGLIAADFLTINATGRMTLAGNIATVGAPLAQQSGPTPVSGGSTLQVETLPTNFGAIAQFVQTGTAMLTDPPSTTLRIQLPATGGTASFANLVGPGANLVLGLGSGSASGSMQVGGLLVLGQGGSANLLGSVAGLTTAAAAALGQIAPAVDPKYTFNGCTIGLAACAPPPVTITVEPPLIPPVVPGGPVWFLPGPALPPVAALPTLDLIELPIPPLLTGELAPEDVVPPNISFEDY
jgi:filamentous hemagglutinin family protein